MFSTLNFRRFKRLLTGRGVILQETIVTGAAADTAILVPTLKAEDELVSVLNVSDLIDMGADVIVDVAASRVIQTYFTVTARRIGPDGNNITVKWHDGTTAGNETAAVDEAGAITVQMEDGVSTFAQLREAMLLVPDIAKLVEAAITTGHTTDAADAEETPLALQNGANSSIKGGVKASREFGSSNARVFVEARVPGTNGQNITVQYATQVGDDADLSVTTTGDRTSGLVKANLGNSGSSVDTANTTGKNTAAKVAAAIRAAAGYLVDARIKNGSGVTYVGTMSATALQNGRDEGEFMLNTTSATKKLKVLWLTAAD